MAHRKRDLIEALSIRFAIAREKNKRRRERRAFHSKRAAVLVLGAALSVGGVTEAFDEVQFLVQKDLDGIQVVRRSPEGVRVVADVSGGLAGDSIYKLASVVPDRFIERRSDLFQTGLFADTFLPAQFLAPAHDEEQESIGATAAEPAGLAIDFAILSGQVREEFFRGFPFGELIHAKAQKYDVDPALVAAVIENESAFKPRARSHRGARGLMQLMPKTGHWMGARNLYDPEQNVDAGVKYLKYLEKRFDGNQTKIIAAYNAGEGNVQRYGGIPPFRETRSYVKKVMQSYEKNSQNLKAYETKALADLSPAR